MSSILDINAVKQIAEAISPSTVMHIDCTFSNHDFRLSVPTTSSNSFVFGIFRSTEAFTEGDSFYIGSESYSVNELTPASFGYDELVVCLVDTNHKVITFVAKGGAGKKDLNVTIPIDGATFDTDTSAATFRQYVYYNETLGKLLVADKTTMKIINLADATVVENGYTFTYSTCMAANDDYIYRAYGTTLQRIDWNTNLLNSITASSLNSYTTNFMALDISTSGYVFAVAKHSSQYRYYLCKTDYALNKAYVTDTDKFSYDNKGIYCSGSHIYTPSYIMTSGTSATIDTGRIHAYNQDNTMLSDLSAAITVSTTISGDKRMNIYYRSNSLLLSGGISVVNTYYRWYESNNTSAAYTDYPSFVVLRESKTLYKYEGKLLAAHGNQILEKSVRDGKFYVHTWNGTTFAASAINLTLDQEFNDYQLFPTDSNGTIYMVNGSNIVLVHDDDDGNPIFAVS